jgi:hypothetical protein
MSSSKNNTSNNNNNNSPPSNNNNNHGNNNNNGTSGQVTKLKQQAASNSISFNTERESKGVHPSKLLAEKQKATQRRSSFSQDSSFSKKEGEVGLVTDERSAQSESAVDQVEEPPAPAPIFGGGDAPRPHGSKSSTKSMMKGILDQKKPPLILTSKPAYSQIHKKREKGEGGSNGEEVVNGE